MKELSLFSGGGGGILASHILGWELVGAAEWDKNPRAMLEARIKDGSIPNIELYSDVQKIDPNDYRNKLDIISGGFPCQPFSTAGFRNGENDPRNMWPATHRLLIESNTKHGFFENVYGLLTVIQDQPSYFGKILYDLVESGYVVTWMVISADSVGAPHVRDRVWILVRRLDPKSVPDLPFPEIAHLHNGSWKTLQDSTRWSPIEKNMETWPRAGIAIKNRAFELANNKISQKNEIDEIMNRFAEAGIDNTWVNTLTSSLSDSWINITASKKVRYYTPTKMDSRRSRSNPRYKGNDLVCQVTRMEEAQGNIQPYSGGRLNPEWVEWLMGWPIGWTSLNPIDPENVKKWEAAGPENWWLQEPGLPRLRPASESIKDFRSNESIAALGNGQVPACAVSAVFRLDAILSVIERTLDNDIRNYQTQDFVDYLMASPTKINKRVSAIV